jgi:hypothetical protein
MKRALCLLLLISLVSACYLLRPEADPQPPDAFFTRVTYAQLPQPVKEWVNNARGIHLAQELVFAGRRYILATYGQQPSGGFGITIEDVNPGQGIISVTVNHTGPAPEAQVTDAITYPRDIGFITNFQDPLEFAATGREEHIPRLVGLRTLREITAQSQGIKIFSPAPGDNVEREISIQGVANVFEGTVLWRLRDIGGNILQEGFTTAGMGDWHSFTITISVPQEVPANTRLVLKLYTESAEDGGMENTVTIPLLLSQ